MKLKFLAYFLLSFLLQYFLSWCYHMLTLSKLYFPVKKLFRFYINADISGKNKRFHRELITSLSSYTYPRPYKDTRKCRDICKSKNKKKEEKRSKRLSYCNNTSTKYWLGLTSANWRIKTALRFRIHIYTLPELLEFPGNTFFDWLQFYYNCSVIIHLYLVQNVPNFWKLKINLR